MNDIGVSGASSGADILAAAKGSRSGKQDDGKGFLDALANSLGNGRNSSGADAGTGASKTANDNSDGDAGAAKAALAIDDSVNVGVGMIDTSAANIANLAGLVKGAKSLQGADPLSLSKSLIELQKTAQAMPGTDPSAAEADPAAGANDPAAAMPDIGKVPTPADAAAQLAEIAQQLAEATAGGQTAPADGNGKAPSAKSDKDTSSADDGKSTATQGAPVANTITDALSLLNVAQTVVAAQEAAANNGQVRGDAKVQGVTLSAAGLKDAAANAEQAMPTDGATTDTAQTFRLARVDGKISALDMSIAKRGEEAADVKISAAAGGDAQTVTVLDSRRYLGLASNSALVTGSLAGNREWSAAMQPGSALSNAANLGSTGKVVNTLKIQLRPDNLGDVTATMRLSGDQLTVDLKVQTGEAYRQLHADQSRMVDALRAQGYQVDSITVSMASNSDQQSDSGRQSGSSQQQQQSLLNQGQGGDARPRGQNYSGQQADGNKGNRGSSERGVDDGAAGGVQRSRSGAVYL
ncbi:flagellar hook-length control protein FliK [Rhizobium lusitanum]|uniref:Chemotaxis protein MotD n=1 Tax=Rhizobium lusitanum TaxID=293958 RepID=A0A7X0IY05_9HYPH|nr:flagellar hook-length control protein FliK [Rhizobium lusitanum]MBB6488042.1 chemotaxis protein MotD [Rhizobium lusitanum]